MNVREDVKMQFVLKNQSAQILMEEKITMLEESYHLQKMYMSLILVILAH